jgi:hypothetical protein
LESNEKRAVEIGNASVKEEVDKIKRRVEKLEEELAKRGSGS